MDSVDEIHQSHTHDGTSTQSVAVQTGDTCDVLSPREAERAFSMSLVVSGIRCTLAYLVFPFLFPVLGFAPGIGPWLGIGIGVVAIVANVFSIRRFGNSNHRLKVPVIAINVGVIALLLVLLIDDIRAVIS